MSLDADERGDFVGLREARHTPEGGRFVVKRSFVHCAGRGVKARPWSVAYVDFASRGLVAVARRCPGPLKGPHPHTDRAVSRFRPSRLPTLTREAPAASNWLERNGSVMDSHPFTLFGPLLVREMREAVATEGNGRT